MYSYIHVCPCPVFGSSFSNTISLLRPAAMFTSFRCFTDGCSAYDGTPLQERIRRLKQNRNVRPRLVRGLDRNLRDFASWSTYIYNYHQLSTYRMAQHCTTSVLEDACYTQVQNWHQTFMFNNVAKKVLPNDSTLGPNQGKEVGGIWMTAYILVLLGSNRLCFACHCHERPLNLGIADLKDPQFAATFETPRCFESVR